MGTNLYLFNWIEHFLKNRKFKVSVDNVSSETFNISTGVPQGSCLSPTLILVYFSHIIKNIPENIQTALYADDLCIWFTSKSLKQIEKVLITQSIALLTKFFAKRSNHQMLIQELDKFESNPLQQAKYGSLFSKFSTFKTLSITQIN